jgi:predicted TIM-barrel fold metal-dependent hydrolase
MKFPLTLLILLILIGSCNPNSSDKKSKENGIVAFDNHVHIMSPTLIEYWKQLGIPFSKTESNYSNIDTILIKNQAQTINLIGMGYVYGNPEYYQGTDRKEKMMAENDYLFQEAAKYSKAVIPYFAIDPLKDYALNEIARCYAINKKSGLKLHFNTSQVYLTEPEHLEKIKIVFAKAASMELPILLHFDNWHPKFGKPDIEILVDSILTDIQPLDLQIAHFGTSGGFNDKTKTFIDAFVELRKQNRISNKHKIKFDISAVALDKDSEGVPKLSDEEFTILREYINKIGLENIVFGTDYPLYTSNEYLQVLKEKLGLNEKEMEKIMH